MNPNTIVVIGFAGCLGGLLGGAHGALLGLTIVLGLVFVVTFVQQILLTRKVQAELQQYQENVDPASWGPPPDQTTTG